MDFYHVLNRGVEKRRIVLNDDDRVRFVRGLYVFNDKNQTPNSTTQNDQWNDVRRTRELLVFIHAWCLMDNHYHILLSPVDDDMKNLTLFMKKLNGGYAKFFNEKYQRSGYLWQGKYKKVFIDRDEQFAYIPFYVHLNPLDFKYKQWREGGIQDSKKAIDFLDRYRWSSWMDYTGEHNFPSVLHKNLLQGIVGDKNTQVEQIKHIITDVQKVQNAEVIEL